MNADRLQTLDDRLENWGLWLRLFPLHYGQCASVEGNYRSPQHWYPPGPQPKQAKAADAWDVSLAAATLALRYHLVLKLRWVIQLNEDRICAIFRRDLHERMAYQELLATEGMAKVLLAEALDEPVAVRRLRAVERVRRIIDRAEDALID